MEVDKAGTNEALRNANLGGCLALTPTWTRILNSHTKGTLSADGQLQVKGAVDAGKTQAGV